MTVLVLLLVVIALALAGAAIIGLLAHLIWWAIVGLVIGALARLVVSGTSGLGFLRTVLFGIAGALLGGLLAGALDVGAFLEFLLAVAAAAALIALFGTDRGRRALDLRR
ncbi:GlsB/YeaQ/YmgE family stress response membrane protein [Miltoncostaea marina]|uniref:GlsB/YeaQ/YmgE family stress response membrane protein n=1 Tax=Miltoncostaea marina TaxID=2843215 RepID=UPI001C3C5AF0|nr:hypothetical protein [Miltoncostaea marina]